MITYAQAEARLRGVVCPKCLHAELSARISLEDGSECVCTAHCEHCGENFVIEFTTFERLEAIQRQIASALRAASCEVCASSDYALQLVCDRASQDCYFEVRCRVCATVYRAEIQQGCVRLRRAIE